MRVACGLFATLASVTAQAAPELVSSQTTHTGLVHEVWRDPTIPARIHVVRADLTSAELTFVATQESDRGLTTKAYGSKVEAQVAINGGAFFVSGYRPRGLAMGAKMAWSNTADDDRSAVFHLRRAADGMTERTVAGIIPPEVVVALGDLPPETEGVISGRPLLIRAGAVEPSFDCSDPVAIACQRAPRSALALSADGNTLWLVTVDGWQAASAGMTAGELSTFLRVTKNPYMAMALDGGSSSTLVLDNAVANQPSDVIERAVANHLAIQFGERSRGSLTGLICKGDVISCRTDLTLRLPGAEVTLDDGRKQVVTAPEAMYNFTNISPRLACVTVRLAGYKTKTACDYVPPGAPGFESVALEEGMDPPDAGPPDGGSPPDASGLLDSGVFPDSGPTDPGGGGGCCDSRGDPSGLAVLGLVGFMLLRRRGTTASR